MSVKVPGQWPKSEPLTMIPGGSTFVSAEHALKLAIKHLEMSPNLERAIKDAQGKDTLTPAFVDLLDELLGLLSLEMGAVFTIIGANSEGGILTSSYFMEDERRHELTNGTGPMYANMLTGAKQTTAAYQGLVFNAIARGEV